MRCPISLLPPPGFFAIVMEQVFYGHWSAVEQISDSAAALDFADAGNRGAKRYTVFHVINDEGQMIQGRAFA